jgi:hypothetical protein
LGFVLMNSDDERRFLERAALDAIGRALRRVFEVEQIEPPNDPPQQLTQQVQAAKPKPEPKK